MKIKMISEAQFNEGMTKDVRIGVDPVMAQADEFHAETQKLKDKALEVEQDKKAGKVKFDQKGAKEMHGQLQERLILDEDIECDEECFTIYRVDTEGNEDERLLDFNYDMDMSAEAPQILNDWLNGVYTKGEVRYYPSGYSKGEFEIVDSKEIEPMTESQDKWYVYMDSFYGVELLGTYNTEEEALEAKAKKEADWKPGYLWTVFVTNKEQKEVSYYD